MSAVLEPLIGESTSVEAALNYTRNTGVRPVNYTFDPRPGVPRNSGEVDTRSVTIRRVARHLSADEAAWRLRRRFAIINFWRPVAGPVLQAPLALCDARTIAPEDLIPSDLVYRDWTGETYAVAHNPRHRWYWYPGQRPSEATLIKIYDSATDGTARLSAHTAFDDPSSASSAAARRSIEIRAIAFW